MTPDEYKAFTEVCERHGARVTIFAEATPEILAQVKAELAQTQEFGEKHTYIVQVPIAGLFGVDE